MPKRTIVDPPSGWRYGFPRVYDPKPGQSYEKWLLEKGYPKADMELALKHSRYWEMGEEDKPDA